METQKLLIIEDDPGDCQTIKDSIERIKEENGFNITFEFSQNKVESLNLLDNTYDGVIIDLKLDNNTEAGQEIINIILKKYRIPIVVFTATPGKMEENPLIRVYKKGEIKFDEIIKYLYYIYNTGLTNILGGRGILETTMNQIFWKNIIPDLSHWIEYKQKGYETEQALLRTVSNHIFEFLDIQDLSFFPEEAYINPPINPQLKTGSIVKKNDADNNYIILSPACDLVQHESGIKTDRILLCEIEKSDINTGDDEQKKKAKEKFKKIIHNNYTFYYHFLPPTERFIGGLINFRKLESHNQKDFYTTFSKPIIQISSNFIKDIISRFSSYYARQGQPDFNEVLLIDNK